jgi:phosphatidylinositol alpha-1,6-mannosyltransferase
VNVLRRQVSAAESWVLFNHLALAQAQAFVPRSFRRPYAIFLHGIEAWHPLPPSGRRTLDGAALLIANSHHTAARVRDANPGVGEIHVCPLALDPDTIGIAAAAEERSLRGRGAPLVLMVGRLVAAERYKGHDQVLEAWPAVRARVPAARLCIVGGGDDQERLTGKAAALGLADAVEFTGFVSDEERAALYERAWVFAMPSQGEGFGLVYLEAMARQLPCIGSRQDAAQEIVQDGVTGYLVDQPDISSLAGRLIALLTDEQARHAMGRAGRARVCTEHTYLQFRHRLLSIIVGANSQLTGAPRWD